MVDERDRRHRRDFEPPPWEKEAFDRFEQERREREEEAQLEAALALTRQVVTEEPVAPVAPDDVPPDEEAPAAREPVDAEVLRSEPEAQPGAVSSAELETMLIGLRHEEPVVARSYKVLANSVVVFLVVGGLGFVVWAAVLFAKVGADKGVTPTLASLLIMVWGFLLMGGAVLLFRKYNL